MTAIIKIIKIIFLVLYMVFLSSPSLAQDNSGKNNYVYARIIAVGVADSDNNEGFKKGDLYKSVIFLDIASVVKFTDSENYCKILVINSPIISNCTISEISMRAIDFVKSINGGTGVTDITHYYITLYSDSSIGKPSKQFIDDRNSQIAHFYNDKLRVKFGEGLPIEAHGVWAGTSISKQKTNALNDKPAKSGKPAVVPKLVLTATDAMRDDASLLTFAKQQSDAFNAAKARRDRAAIARQNKINDMAIKNGDDKQKKDFADSQKSHLCSHTQIVSEFAYTEPEARSKIHLQSPGSAGINVMGEPYTVSSMSIFCNKEKTNINPRYVCIGTESIRVRHVGTCGGSGPSKTISR